MTKSKTKLIFQTLSGLCIVLLLFSCKIYYIPIDSFKTQFANIDSSRLKKVTAQGPIGDKLTYKTFVIDYIICVDNKGNTVKLPMSPLIEIRFTDNNNHKTIMYLDRITVTDDVVSGSRSRIISAIKKSIPLKDIKKIEVQDGKKNYRYVG